MKQQIVRITTADTKKTYEFPPKAPFVNPDIWEVSLMLRGVGNDGQTKYGFVQQSASKIFVELSTLQAAGVTPRNCKEVSEKQEETVEDLIIRLLEHVGHYPTW